MRILTGLRSRILFTVGASTAIIMMLLSWGMLYSWRDSLLKQEKANASAVSGAFSVAVIDALIFADQDLYQSEGFLDNYVVLFMDQNPRLTAITILEDSGRIVARSWDREDPPWISGDLSSLLAVSSPKTNLTADSEGEWVLETVFPMRTGNRSWGVLVLAVEAESIRGQIRRNFIQLALFSSSVTSLLLLLLWLLLDRILSSLQVLVAAMDQVDINVAEPSALPVREDEIGILFQHFHRMKERVDQSRQDLLAAQRQIWHAERLAAIGRLASGLAHEINNPINGVRNCIYAIRGDLNDRDQTVAYLDMMDEGLTSASSVIEKLLGFARKQQSEPGPVVLNDSLDAVGRLVSFDLDRKQIRLELKLDPDLPAVMSDRQLMQEVIMNLMINAIDAVEPGGKIVVTSRSEGPRVVLDVRDSGVGIPAEVLDRVFEPFFTTKRTGEGTGLGLSICLSIVQASGGSLSVSSEVGRGTTFTIDLPAHSVSETEESIL